MRKIVSLFLLAMAVVAPLGLRAQDECSVTLPWSENFDSYTAVNGTSKPNCWTRLTGFQVNATTVRPNLYSFGGGKVLYCNLGVKDAPAGAATSTSGAAVAEGVRKLSVKLKVNL